MFFDYVLFILRMRGVGSWLLVVGDWLLVIEIVNRASYFVNNFPTFLQ